MPRRNKPRQVTYEAQLARRIQYEREARDLTFDRLAEKLTEAGCPIQGSAIYKIEKSDPPRRITVNELVTFAQVFGLRVNELLVPVEIASSKAMLKALEDWTEAFNARRAAIEEHDKRLAVAARRVRKALERDEHAEAALRSELEARFGTDSHWVEDLMEDFRGEHQEA